MFQIVICCLLVAFYAPVNGSQVEPSTLKPPAQDEEFQEAENKEKLVEGEQTWKEFQTDLQSVVDEPATLEKALYSLVDLIDLALMNDATTKQAWARAKSSNENWKESQGSLYPTLTAQATGKRERIPLKNFQSDHVHDDALYSTVTRPEVSGSWNLYDFGVTQAAIKQSLYQFLYEQRNYQWIIQTTIKSVIASYYHFLGAQATLDSQKAALKDAQMTLDSVIELKKAGLKTQADVLQAQSTYSQNLMEVEKAEGAVNITLGSLAISVGLSPTIQFDVMIPVKEPQKDILLQKLDDLLQKAHVCRQDLLAAKAQIADKEMAFKKAKRSVLPQLSLAYDVGENHYETSNSVSSSGYDASASLELSLPLFSGFSDIHKIRKQKYALLAAQASYDVLKSQVELDVLTYYYGMQTASKNLNYSHDYLNYSQENYEINFENFRAGNASILDLLSAQTTLAQARQTRVEAITDWYTMLSGLIFSIGLLDLPRHDGDWIELIDAVTLTESSLSSYQETL